MPGQAALHLVRRRIHERDDAIALGQRDAGTIRRPGGAQEAYVRSAVRDQGPERRTSIALNTQDVGAAAVVDNEDVLTSRRPAGLLAGRALPVRLKRVVECLEALVVDLGLARLAEYQDLSARRGVGHGQRAVRTVTLEHVRDSRR